MCVCVYASSTLAVSNELFKERLRIDQLPLSLILCVQCVFLTIKDTSSKEPIHMSNTHTHFNHKKFQQIQCYAVLAMSPEVSRDEGDLGKLVFEGFIK